MAHYIIQTIAFQLFFLLVYDLFLKKETFFNWNRIYLLATAVLSLILPFIKVDRFKDVVPQDYIVSLPEIILGQTGVSPNKSIILDPVIIENNPLSTLEIIFYSGVFVALCLFLLKVVKILILIVKNPKQSIGNVVLVELLNSSAAFSFFHYIFLGEYIKTEDKDTILKHELIHTEQKHTIDLLFFEVLRVLFWFNPLVYMYQRRLATLHEFIADANALKHQDKETYYQDLLAQVFETKNISFINTFFNQSLIKKRIVMLSRSKSRQIHLFKYALLIPLVFGMLIYTSTGAQEEVGQNRANQSVTELGDLSDDELKEKFRKEYEQMKANGADFLTIAKAFVNEGASYILSREDYYRNLIFSKENLKRYKTKGIKLTTDPDQNYAGYLEWKKTDEAKENWENNTFDGILKLVVNDLNNLTSEEEIELGKKKALLFKDVFFVMLKMTDVKGSGIKVFYQPNEFSSANKRDDSKALMLNETVIDVGYDVIDQVPVFPGCEGLTKGKQKQCTTEKITEHIVKSFNTEIGVKLGVIGRQRIYVIFKIDKNGDVVGVRSRASHPDLEAEAIRVVNSLPKMIPGKHKGKQVEVPYSLPIIFQIQDDALLNQTIVDKIEERLVTDNALDNNDIDVPFSVIDQVPIYPGCEDLPSSEQKTCISDHIKKHVNKNFNTKLAKKLDLKGRQRINVIFKIDKEGHIMGVKSRGPHPALEAEAIRVIKTLPKMIPGKHRGKSVSVPYSLPIIFQVADPDEISNESVVPFAVVEEVPIYPGCEDLQGNIEKKDCMSENITNFVIKNFNTKIASQHGLSGRQRVNVIFKINKEGAITGIRSRAPHPALEEEAIRVISLLPKMKPGIQDGKVVTVPYSLPIIFEVEDDTQLLNEVTVVGYQPPITDVPFSVVEQIPIFPGCEGSLNREELMTCTSDAIKKHVNKNFKTKLARRIGLKGRQRINVIFKINKEGTITGIKSRGPHPDLEAEAIRVINTLPKMIPGKQKGKTVNVLFSLPIIFQVSD